MPFCCRNECLPKYFIASRSHSAGRNPISVNARLPLQQKFSTNVHPLRRWANECGVKLMRKMMIVAVAALALAASGDTGAWARGGGGGGGGGGHGGGGGGGGGYGRWRRIWGRRVWRRPRLWRRHGWWRLCTPRNGCGGPGGFAPHTAGVNPGGPRVAVNRGNVRHARQRDSPRPAVASAASGAAGWAASMPMTHVMATVTATPTSYGYDACYGGDYGYGY